MEKVLPVKRFMKNSRPPFKVEPLDMDAYSYLIRGLMNNTTPIMKPSI